MKRKYSLKGKLLFRELYQKGYKLQEKGIQVFVLKKSELAVNKKHYDSLGDGNTKIGLSVNKKSGKANIRNLIKRRLRSICMEFIKEMDPEYCIIIRPVKDIQNLRYGDYRKTLQVLFNRSGIMK